MTYTDEKVDLIINKLTRAQYESLRESGEIDDNQLYMITDDPSMNQIVSGLRDKGDLHVYAVQGNDWDLPEGFINIVEATITEGEYIFIAVGQFGTVYSKESYTSVEQRNAALSVTFEINGKDVVVTRTAIYNPTDDTLITFSELNAAENRLSYLLNTDDTIVDRRVNVVTSDTMIIPEGFNDLIIRFSGAIMSITFSGSDRDIIVFGDDIPTTMGDYLITITRISANECYIRIINLEQRN